MTVSGAHISSRRIVTVIAVLVAGLALAVLLRILVGNTGHGWPSDPHIMDIRMFRVALAVLVGAALAAAGVALQALLRNPLAEPYILGLSSGAGVGLMVQTFIVAAVWHRIVPGYVGALSGALISMAVVYAVGRRRGVIDPLGLLLVGVVLSTVNSAIIMVLYTFYPPGVTNDTLRWMMGFLNEGIGVGNVWIVAAMTTAGFAMLLHMSPSMDAASFSDAEAMSLGVNLPSLRRKLFVVSGLLAAGAVVLAGPISFVGLICPHVARLLLGPRHRVLLVGSVLAGAMLIVLADAASVAIDAASDKITSMPIGVFTAVIGGAVFLWVLRPYLGRGME